MIRNEKLYRWSVVALISLGTIINYLSRNTLAVLAPQLETVLHFGVREYSYIVAAFQLAYTVMQPVCGMILDFLGMRLGFALFAVVWSIASILHASANGWPTLAIFRGGLGASEAAAVPAGIKAISEWF
ncbi:MAG: MFS transporter, partial [Alphaproteobacteria bacterium]|nr:MFS transporter [Alphaproteobacteria bacterium]